VRIGSTSTYDARVQRLHELVQAELERRARMQRVHGGRCVA